MHVFVTGASGDIAAHLIPELVRCGHTVTGLARSDAAAERVSALDAEVVRGDLSDLATLRRAAAASDGVIHLAFDHARQGAGDLAGAVVTDLAAVSALGEGLAGSDKPLVGTNATGGIALAGFRGLLTEDVTLPGGPRIDAENQIITLADSGVRACVIRLPPAVHSPRKYGFVSQLVHTARTWGASGFVGDGSNRWPAADVTDVAHLYRLALEAAPAGARLHAVAEEGIALRDIAAVIGERLRVPVVSVDPNQATARFAHVGPFVALDNPASSAATRSLLGWEPTGVGLLDALREDPTLGPAAG